MTASHSSWSAFNIAGILVLLGGFGFTIGGTLTSIKSWILNSLFAIGSIPFSAINFSISLFSKIDPDTGERTGCSGTSLLTGK